MYRCRMTLRVLITLTAVLALCTSLALAKDDAPQQISIQPLQQAGPNWDLKAEMNQNQGADQGTIYEDEASKVGPHRDAQPQRGRTYSSVYLSEDFEGSIPPAGWGSVVTNAGFTWKAHTLNPWSGAQATDVEYDPALTPQDEWIITPVMDFTTATTDLRLDFYWNMSYYWAVSPFDNYDLEVYVSTDGGSSFPDLIWDENGEGLFNNFEWYNKVLDLSSYAGQSSVAIGFRYVGSDGAQAVLDLVSVTDDPPPLGRCCFAGGTSCSDETELDCFGMGGESWDEGLSCGSDPCPMADQGDNCSDPLLISLPAEIPYLDKDQTTCGRGNDYDATCLDLYDGGEDIIYKISVASEVTVDITLDPQGTTYTGFAIDDAACPLDAGLSDCIAKSTNSSGTAHSITGLTLSPGDYFLMVDTWPTPDCIPLFDLTIDEAAPATPGDNCAAPFELTLGSGDLPYTEAGLYSCGRGDNYNATCLGSYDGGEDFMMELTLTEPLALDITLDPNSDGVDDENYFGFAIDDVCPLDGSGSCIAFITSSSSYDAKTIYNLSLAAGTYYIMVDTWPSPACLTDFDLTFAIAMPPPPNDDCATAEATGDVTNLPFSTAAASFDGPGGCQTAPNIWYEYTAPIDGAATFSLCGSSYDTKMAVYDECGGTELACNDDYCSLQSQVTLPITMGETYLVEVGGYSSTVGDGLLTIFSFIPPDNDNCEDVTPVTLTAGVPVNFTGDNTFATNQCSSLLASDGETWHAFELTECSNVTIDLCGTTPAWGNAWVVVVDGCPCSATTLYSDFNTTDCGDGNVTINFNNLPAGVYYYPVLKDPAYGAIGAYNINVVSEPSTSYCEAGGGGDEYISNVEFVSISNPSGEDGYADYTDQSTAIVKGEAYPLDVENGNGYGSDQCAAWIDWNQDMCFDASEQVGYSTGSGPYAFSVTAPAGALEGETVMRVRITYTGAVGSCGSTTYGEVEDYSVEVFNNEPTCTIDPEPMFLYYLFAVVPVTCDFNFGMFDGGYTAADVDLSSVTVNGHALGTPIVLSGTPGFVGDNVYGTLSAATFLADYGVAIIGSSVEEMVIEGQFTDLTPFSISDGFVLAGKTPGPFSRYIEPYVPGNNTVYLPGDFDLSGNLSIGDAVAIIGYIFGGGPSPDNVLIGDTDCSESVSIGDAVNLINYIFASGAAPCVSQ